MIRATCVRVHRRQVGDREFDGITVTIADLRMSCDLMNDRQIRLAHDLAQTHKAAFVYDEINADRVIAALASAKED